MSDNIRLLHLADLHLGYPGPANFVVEQDKSRYAGRYVRDVDIELATIGMIDAILALQPKVDVVVIAGDLFHRADPRPRAIDMAAYFARRMIDRQIEVVIVNGNHDTTPGRMHYGNPLDFLRHQRACIVNGAEYEIVGGGQLAWQVNQRLRNRLLVHALPYQATIDKSFAGVHPQSGMFNILLAHGRVGGAKGLPDTNTLGQRTAEIPAELLRRGWHYVALGDWHIHRHRPLSDAPAYYAGSLEALTFGEAVSFPPSKDDPRTRGGGLVVDLTEDEALALVTLPNTRRRAVYILRPIDAAGMDSEGLMEKLRDRLEQDLPSDALVRLDITQCSPNAYNELDQAEVIRLRRRVRRCDFRPQWAMPEGQGSNVVGKSLEEQWEDFLSDPAHGFSEPQIRTLAAAGQERLQEARALRQERSDSEDFEIGDIEAVTTVN
jgi:hypothetical protein